MLRGSFLPKTMPSSISWTTSRSVVSRPTCPAAASSRISRAVCSSSSPPPTSRPSVRAALRRASCRLPVCAAARSAASLPRPEILDGPKLRLPGRDYFLFTGPLGAALQLGDPGGIWSKSPNLYWPEDHSWCVATEIDFDSTLVGGSRDLVDAVLAHQRLEAWPITADDSLAWDGDTINPWQRT
jgi:hypothetical protein